MGNQKYFSGKIGWGMEKVQEGGMKRKGMLFVIGMSFFNKMAEYYQI